MFDCLNNAYLILVVKAGGVATKHNILQRGILVQLFANLVTSETSCDRLLIVGCSGGVGLQLHDFLFPGAVALLYEIVAEAHRLELFSDFCKFLQLNETYAIQRTLGRKLDLPICLR